MIFTTSLCWFYFQVPFLFWFNPFFNFFSCTQKDVKLELDVVLLIKRIVISVRRVDWRSAWRWAWTRTVSNTLSSNPFYLNWYRLFALKNASNYAYNVELWENFWIKFVKQKDGILSFLELIANKKIMR